MKKSIAIVLLVATSVVAIAVGAGIWYTRPSAPLAILEEAKARQAQPLLEVTPPQRAEVIPLPPDYQPLIDELLPLLKAELTPASETTLSREQQAYVDQAVETLRRELLQSIDTQANRAYVDRQVDSLKRELTTGLARVEEKQLDRQALIDSVTADDLRPIFSVYRDELLRQVRAEQPRTTVVMSGDIDEEVLFNNLAWEIEDNLDFYATYARDAILSTIDSADVIALYESYRPLLVADLATSLPPSTTVIATAEPIDPQQVFNEFAKEIETNKTFYATYVRDAVLDTISEEDLLGFYTYYRPFLAADLMSTPAQVTVSTADVLTALGEEIETHKEFYAAYVRDAVLESISDEDLFAYYSYYRPVLLADLYQGVKDEAKTEIADYANIIDQMEANREYYLAHDRKALPGVLTEADILPLYATYRGELAEDLFNILGEEIESNKSAYAAYVRSAIGNAINEDDLIDLYLEYRDQIAADLAQNLQVQGQAISKEDVLAVLAVEVESNKDAYATWARDAILDTISDEYLLDIYSHYRPALIADLVSELPKAQPELDLDTLLENFYTEIEANKHAYATYVRDALLETMIGDPEFDQAYEASQKTVNAAEVLNALGEEIEANKSFYATYVRDAVLDTISEDDLVDLYLTYRDALIEDLGTVDGDQLMLILAHEIESNQSAYAAWARDAIAETISDDLIIDLYLNYRDLLVDDLINEMPEAQQQADREQLFNALFSEIDSNKSFYAAWARDAIIDTISDEDLISYYLYYRPELLEDIYQGLKDRFTQPTPVVVPPAPPAAVQRTVVREVEETFTPPALVIQEEAPPALVVEEEPAAAVSDIQEEVFAPPAPPRLVVEELLPESPFLPPRVPPAPGVIRKPLTVIDDIPPAEYEELRQQRRNEALDEVLRKLS